MEMLQGNWHNLTVMPARGVATAAAKPSPASIDSTVQSPSSGTPAPWRPTPRAFSMASMRVHRRKNSASRPAAGMAASAAASEGGKKRSATARQSGMGRRRSMSTPTGTARATATSARSCEWERLNSTPAHGADTACRAGWRRNPGGPRCSAPGWHGAPPWLEVAPRATRGFRRDGESALWKSLSPICGAVAGRRAPIKTSRADPRSASDPWSAPSGLCLLRIFAAPSRYVSSFPHRALHGSLPPHRPFAGGQLPSGRAFAAMDHLLDEARTERISLVQRRKGDQGVARGTGVPPHD